MLPALARAVAVPIDELLGDPRQTRSKRGPQPRLMHHMERISQLPKPKQRMLMEMIDAVLAQQGR